MSVEIFANLSVVEYLGLSYNNLRIVDKNILKELPKLFTLYLYDNPLQCDCQLQEVWRWCQDHNIRRVYETAVPEGDTPSEEEGICLGVLEKGQCLLGNIFYYRENKITSYSDTHIEDMDRETEPDTKTK